MGDSDLPARPHVLFVSDNGAGVRSRRALVTAGFQITPASLDDPVRDLVETIKPNVVVVAYQAAVRQRAWAILTVLRGSRSLRAIPVIVATDDVEQVAQFRDPFATLGITVLIEPDDDELVAAVRRRTDTSPPPR